MLQISDIYTDYTTSEKPVYLAFLRRILEESPLLLETYPYPSFKNLRLRVLSSFSDPLSGKEHADTAKQSREESTQGSKKEESGVKLIPAWSHHSVTCTLHVPITATVTSIIEAIASQGRTIEETYHKFKEEDNLIAETVLKVKRKYRIQSMRKDPKISNQQYMDALIRLQSNTHRLKSLFDGVKVNVTDKYMLDEDDGTLSIRWYNLSFPTIHPFTAVASFISNVLPRHTQGFLIVEFLTMVPILIDFSIQISDHAHSSNFSNELSGTWRWPRAPRIF